MGDGFKIFVYKLLFYPLLPQTFVCLFFYTSSAKELNQKKKNLQISRNCFSDRKISAMQCMLCMYFDMTLETIMKQYQLTESVKLQINSWLEALYS